MINIESKPAIRGNIEQADRALVEGIVRRFAKYNSQLRAMKSGDVLDWFCNVEGRIAFLDEIKPEPNSPVVLE